MPTYSSARPSKINPNLDFWFENRTIWFQPGKWLSSHFLAQCFPAFKKCFNQLLPNKMEINFEMESDQGCQMVYFNTKNPNVGIFWRALE
jgi:hypothetical protein